MLGRNPEGLARLSRLPLTVLLALLLTMLLTVLLTVMKSDRNWWLEAS